MNSKILFAIPTCNRSLYAKNCINSLIKFSDLDRIKILVLDNCTVEEGWLEYLQTVAKNYGVIVHRVECRDPGELYHSMNWAIQYCRKEKIKIVHWLQDDYQFVFKHEQQIDAVLDAFRQRTDIIQIRTNLVWGSFKNEAPATHGIIKSQDINFAVCLRPADNGFTRVEAYDKTGLYPKNTMIHWAPTGKKEFVFGEKWFGQVALKLGFRQAACLLPNICPLFSACRIRGNYRYGEYFPPPKEFYIKPFTKEKIGCLIKSNKNLQWSDIKNIAEPDGWIAKNYGRKSYDPKIDLLPPKARMSETI